MREILQKKIGEISLKKKNHNIDPLQSNLIQLLALLSSTRQLFIIIESVFLMLKIRKNTSSNQLIAGRFTNSYSNKMPRAIDYEKCKFKKYANSGWFSSSPVSPLKRKPHHQY